MALEERLQVPSPEMFVIHMDSESTQMAIHAR
jgi:hypothetical protein